ncbi:MAG: copper chaperone PCu(A)C [Bdellovibrionaceae bacterium]|nr:copper chaperone PCu(A)C [Pseudobdellovibrionaceae bacterium]MDW8189437.1 copper chaperone PCu(A)C [Pseudobdellovibrionaceae bacterium]
MKKMHLMVFFALFVTGIGSGHANKEKEECDVKNAVVFENPRVFLPMGNKPTGGFVHIKNNCATEVELIFQKADGFKAVETHITVEEDGKMAMKRVESFKIAPKGALELVPRGKHLMLFEPTKKWKEGDTVDLTFTINKVTRTVAFPMISRMEKHH